MSQIASESTEFSPIVSRRARGDWLAKAPPGARFAIAVTAPTASEAENKFRLSYRRWEELLSQEILDVPKLED